MNKTDIPIAQLVQRIQKQYPQSWKSVKPKMFKNVEKWHDYRRIYLRHVFALGMVKGEMMVGIEKDKLLDAYLHWHLQKSFNTPIFFVDNFLMDAVLQTDPIDFDWKTMRLPFPSFNFVLTEKALQINNRDVAIIRVSRFSGKELNEISADFGHSSAKTNITKIFQIYLETDNGDAYHKNLCEWMPGAIPKATHEIDQKTKELLDRMPGIIFNLLFAMAARPEYVETGKKIGVHKKSQSELWTPNIIGRTYQIKRAKGESIGSHNSPRLHWRRGHFRRQKCGFARLDEKIIWIEPVMVGTK